MSICVVVVLVVVVARVCVYGGIWIYDWGELVPL